MPPTKKAAAPARKTATAARAPSAPLVITDVYPLVDEEAAPAVAS